MTPANHQGILDSSRLKRRANAHRRQRHARRDAPALRERYGVGPHTLALPADDLRDLVRALRIVAGVNGAVVAAACGCSETHLYRLMNGRDRKQKPPGG
jgi:hypothetical protein